MKSLLLLLVLAGLCLAGCSSSGSHAAPADLDGQLRTAGVVCPGKADLDAHCIYKGENVRVSYASWSSSVASRKAACADGYVNRRYLVATNGQLTIAPDYNSTARVLARALSLKVTPYCPRS